MKLGVHIGYWGLGPDRARTSSRSSRRPSGSATTRVWTAEAYGSDAATILGWLAGQTDDDQARLGDLPDARPLAGDDGDDRRDARPALRRADAARHRLVAGRRWPRAGTASASAASSSARASTSRSCAWRWRASASSSTARRSSCRCPTGPGKALKLTIAPVQERIPIYLAAIGPKNTTLAAEIADGWIPTLFSPEHVGEFRPLLEEGFARAGRQVARRLRHRADGQRLRHRRPSSAARDAMRPVRRALRRRDGLAQAELLQPARAALRLRGRRARGPGPLPRGQAGRGGGGAARRADRHGLAVRARATRVRERLAVYRDAGRRHADASRRWRGRSRSASSSCGSSPSWPR